MVLQIIEIHKQRETFDFLKPNLADINELTNPVNSKKTSANTIDAHVTKISNINISM